ncbi:MAG: carbon-nitrogen hydrolase family protein [Alteromonadaceae bacterium]|nr:carbon-nitrogen hydrolase family protein [Alteromonadaceae bacterium]MBL4910498.1 carbon-nitrogen hydrolase family protein [Alteromonadaceae bacterium]
MARLTAIQLNSVTNVDENLAKIRKILKEVPQTEQHLVVLPECCLFFGGKDQEQLLLAEQDQQNQKLVAALASIARDFAVTLVAGTIPVLAPTNKSKALVKFYNRSCVFSPAGQLIASYDKIHLFDVKVSDKTKAYRESDHTQAGSHTTVANIGFAQLGLSVCYDLRFPELYRQLQQQGADIITVPSAFTKVTGKAHWHVLLQARAIENQVFVIAAGQEGVHQNGRETWGHSMIISPWGDILAIKDVGEGFVSAEVELSNIARIRANMPVATHNQFNVQLKVPK